MKNIFGSIHWIVLGLVSVLSSYIIIFSSGFDVKLNLLPSIDEQVAAGVEIQSPYPLALKTPEKVKGIYLTGYTFSNKKRRTELINLVKTTELNSLVIDFKDPDGKLMFQPISEEIIDWPTSPVALDRQDYINILDQLQDEKIYTIARITTFQDPTAVKTFPDLALKNKSGGVWLDYKGVSWLDMTNEAVWDLVVAEAVEAALIGFDEIQFDYIRFPSDGNIRQIQYHNFTEGSKRYESIVKFFKYLKIELQDISIPLSLDLFGLTYQRQSNVEYDLNIGQRLVDAAPYFDFISPMVYPSHYPRGFLNFSNPANHPYEVVNKALLEGNFILTAIPDSIAQTRPWLQDFDLGAHYNADMIRAQIKASDDNNVSGWLLWNASNRYTESALESVDK